MDDQGRLYRLSRKLRGLDAALVTSRANVRYLTGFTGSSGFVLVSRDSCTFVTDFRYSEQCADEVKCCNVSIDSRALHFSVKALCRKLGLRRVGFEGSLPYEQYVSVKSTGLKLEPMGQLLERMRERKDEEELRLIRQAVERAEKAFLDVKPWIRAGARESEIALRLEKKIRQLGSRCVPFDIIVASGPNSSRPHATATGRKLGPGDLVTIDWGAEAGGYFSDMTRTFLLRGGKDVPKKKRIYSLVLEANRRAVKKLRAGAGLRDVDSAARDHIAKAGYGEHFGHGLGHGVGLEVHERPRLSPKSRAKARPGMVVTVEPGIYVPGLGGVRIEEMALVGDKGARVLTKLPVQLEIIGSGR